MSVILDARGNEFSGALDVITNQVYTEARDLDALLGALNSEAVCDLNGHSDVVVDLRTAAMNATLVFEGTVDGVNYVPIVAFDQATQAMIAQVVVTTTLAKVYFCNVAGFKRFRVRVSVYTSGNVVVAMRGTRADNSIIAVPTPASLAITATGTSGAGVTLTIAAAGAGLFHFITRLLLQRFAVAALTGAATPVIVTTTNLPGSRAFSIPADGAAIGTVYSEIVAPAQPIKSSVANTNTTIVAPATTNTIWRITADYYVGA